MNDLKECYRVLEIDDTASIEAVKEAYRALVNVWHPDRFTHDAKLQLKMQEKLKQINIAYEAIIKQTSGGSTGSGNSSGAQHNRRETGPIPESAEEYYQMGLVHFQSDSSARNIHEAVKCFRKSAEFGHPGAQNYLGFLYTNGNGVKQDFDEAIRLFKLAAEQKNPHAMYNLALIYNKRPKNDKIEVQKWSHLALLYGVKKACLFTCSNTDRVPLSVDSNEALLRASYLFPAYFKDPPQTVLHDLAASFLDIVKNAHKGIYKIVQSKHVNMEDGCLLGGRVNIIGLIADQIYSFKTHDFFGQSSPLLKTRFKYLFGGRSENDAIKECARLAVVYHYNNLQRDIAVLREQRFIYVWSKEVMPRLNQ